MSDVWNGSGRYGTTQERKASRLLENRPKDFSAKFQEHALSEQGIGIHTSARVDRATNKDGGVLVEADQAGKTLTFQGGRLLVATGRRPALDKLNLETAGVEHGRKGIKVNEYLTTANTAVYAAGDVLPSLQLEHVAVYEGWLAANNMFSEGKETVDYRVIPRVMFTYPEVAGVGQTEEEAARDKKVVTATLSYSAVAMAKIGGEPQGLIKLVADVSSGQLVGAHIVGHDAGNLIHLAALAMKADVPVDQVATTVSAYPTLAQGFFYAAEVLAEKFKQ